MGASTAPARARTNALVWQNRQRMIQTRRIDPNLVVADPFEHERHLLDGRMNEVY
jgi:hypothetical protein